MRFAKWISRIAAVVIAVIYLIVAMVDSGRWLVPLAAGLLIPLALIWFPQAIGNATNYRVNRQYIDQPTPPILIALAGWFFLVGVPLIIWWNWKR